MWRIWSGKWYINDRILIWSPRGDRISSVMELEASGPGVGLEVWSWHGITNVTMWYPCHLHWLSMCHSTFEHTLGHNLTLYVHTPQPCYTLCNTVPELWSLLPPDLCSFQDPYCILILTSNLNSVFGTLYTQPCPTLPVSCSFLATLTKASVIPSQTYSSPCCARNPA